MIKDVIIYLQSILDKADCFHAQSQVMDQLVSICHQIGEGLERVYKYVCQDHAWKAVVSPQEFPLHFKHIKEAVSEVCIAQDCAKIA